jgi:hypothetical protein
MRNKDPKIMMIKEKIDRLSTNEDDRQDLWVRYLENPDSDLYSNIEDISFRNSIRDRIADDIVNLYTSTLKVGFVQNILSNFTDLERSIIVLILLGLSNEQISRYKMIGLLRLNQTLHNISLHPVWETLRVEEKAKLGAEARADR